LFGAAAPLHAANGGPTTRTSKRRPETSISYVRGGVEGAKDGETFVIDSPVLPDELDALPALLEQSRFPLPSDLLATHADWDHLLGRLAFPDAPLGCAESSAARPNASCAPLTKICI
jgi:glyoxylase-like metal-dependent hydrolase (beta-lactamase superfamily II)